MTEEIKFEKALERLSKIVEDLESGDVTLEDAIKKYEEGVRLSKTCQDQLVKAEKKIEILTKSLDGKITKEPFDAEAASDAKPVRKMKKQTHQADDVSDDDKDLLF